jgi:endoglucanase
MELLKRLSEAAGIPGHEKEIRAIIKDALHDHVDTVRTDPLGNLIAHRKGEGPVVLIAAHMDEIGFIVSFIEKETGFLRLHPLGGFDPKTLIAQRVIVHTATEKLIGCIGSKAIHIMTDEERKKLPEMKDLFVDLGLPEDRVRELVSLGDMITLRQDFIVGEHVISGKAPQIGIALDTTLAVEMPGVSPAQQITQLGKGVAIKLADSASISHTGLVQALKKLAEKRKIPYQMEILPRGGTDAGALQRAQAGAAVVTLSLPSRYVHSVVEMSHRDDLKAAIDLLAAFLETAGEIDLGEG